MRTVSFREGYAPLFCRRLRVNCEKTCLRTTQPKKSCPQGSTPWKTSIPLEKQWVASWQDEISFVEIVLFLGDMLIFGEYASCWCAMPMCQAFCVFNVAETVDSLGGTGIDVESIASCLQIELRGRLLLSMAGWYLCHPCMVYVPTLSYTFKWGLVNVGKHTIHGCHGICFHIFVVFNHVVQCCPWFFAGFCKKVAASLGSLFS